jgi:hypothetical protein
MKSWNRFARWAAFLGFAWIRSALGARDTKDVPPDLQNLPETDYVLLIPIAAAGIGLLLYVIFSTIKVVYTRRLDTVAKTNNHRALVRLLLNYRAQRFLNDKHRVLFNKLLEHLNACPVDKEIEHLSEQFSALSTAQILDFAASLRGTTYAKHSATEQRLVSECLHYLQANRKQSYLVCPNCGRIQESSEYQAMKATPGEHDKVPKYVDQDWNHRCVSCRRKF